tara:strand:+ start:224 stop:718 length:495 start_codon:yes stop_codon:yes gene_type:complete
MKGSIMKLVKANREKADELCKQDPVRPDLPLDWRVEENIREVYYLESHVGNHRGTIPKIDAVLCLAKCDRIPISEDEILTLPHGAFVVFYSVWSNTKGAGRQIIFDALDHYKELTKPCPGCPEYVFRYITMSPKTEMAKNFHLRNGAVLLQENKETYNFEYMNE